MTPTGGVPVAPCLRFLRKARRSARDTRCWRTSALTKITEHVYWMPPGPPDRPSLSAVVGDRRTVMVDAGSSAAHTRAFLDVLFAASGTRPTAVVYTHSHWDHVLGGAEVGGMVIAHALTVELLTDLVERDWSDEGLDRRVAVGLSSPQHAAHVKAEPSPLGDCLSASPTGATTPESVARLRDVILGSAAEHYIEGHHESVSSRREIEALFEKIGLAERAVRDRVTIEPADEDTRYFVDAFRAGLSGAS
jgi:hypothetical protein